MKNKNEKTHGEVGVNSILGDHAPVTEQVVQGDELLSKLYHLLEDNVLLDIKHNVSIATGEHRGGYQPTTGTVGLPLQNKDYEVVSLLCIRPNVTGSNRYHVTDTSQPCAVFLGVPNASHELVITDNLADGVALAGYFLASKVTVLVSPTKALFTDTVKHFAQDATVTIFPDINHKDKMSKLLAGHNVKMVIPDLMIMAHVEANVSYAEVLSYADTKVIELEQSGWGELGDISDSESKATRYPIEAWGDEGTILRDAVTATAYFSQVPLAMAGQCVLGALANIIQQYVNAPYSDSNDFMPACLFLLTEMASGGGKSKTVSQYSHKELIKYQKEKRLEYRTLKAEWEAAKAATPKKDLEVWLFQNPKPKQFILFAKSGTLIGFLDNMLMGNTTDVAWSTAEAALFLSSHSLTSETAKSNISQICDIWSGGEFDRLLSPRYSTIDEIGMDGVRFTLDLQGQPPIIAPALNDEVMSGQGLLPRFLFAFPDSLNGTLVFNTDERLDARPEKDKRLQAYWKRCRELLDPSQGSLNKDEDGRIIRYNMPFESREARKALADYRTERERSLQKGGTLEKYSEYAKRLHENASRIAAILAYFNGKRFISVDDIQRATKLTDFSMSERIRYTDKPQAGDNDTQKLLNWLIRYCQKEGVKKLAYSTAQSKVTPKTLRFKPTFDLLIDVLESENYIKVIVNGRARTIQLRPELLAH